jgi:polyisoprenoid-binding protein YceI
MNRLFSLSIILVLVSFVASGQTKWQLDKAHSNIGFSIAHLVVTDVTGSFKSFDGTVATTGDDFSTMKIEFTIEANSINTDNERRDEHLRSPDFFDAAKYPNLTFKSTKVEKTGENSYKITGDLTMHGKTNPVVLEATLRGPVMFMETTRVGVKAATSLNRYDYDLKWNKTLEAGGLLVGEEVAIIINIELVKAVE